MNKEFKSIRIDKSWIENNIEHYSWQRNIYPSRVNYFINSLREGRFVSSIITLVKLSNGKFNLLDGQHRIKAIYDGDFQIEMDCLILSNINENTAKKEYYVKNDVKQHRLIDDIKFYLTNYPILEKIMDEKNFPISITLNGGVNAMRIDAFMNVIQNGFSKTVSRRNLTRAHLVYFLENLSVDKYELVKQFCAMYKKTFGEPSKDNWLYRNIVMYTLLRIWLANRTFFTESEFVEDFRKIENSAPIRQNSSVTSTEYLQKLTMQIYRVINYKKSVNKFIYFWKDFDNLLEIN